MKKYLFAIPIFVLAMTFVHAQGGGESGEQAAIAPASQMDSAVRILAEELNKKLIAGKAGKIAVGQFAYKGNAVPIGSYWINQLTGELANIPNRSYIVLSAGVAGADWTITGEIIDTADGAVRFYTRLIRTEGRAIEASFHFDFERNEQIAALLVSEGSQGASDTLEPDSFENPVEISINANAPIVIRALHSGDEDFFLLLPANDGSLIVETTGSTDTFMELYNADTRQKLAEDDDGGRGANARIRYNVQAGQRYIAKVRGYDGETGAYGFRAYIHVRVYLIPDEYEPDNDAASAKQREIGIPQQHNFHLNTDDVDWVKFQITQPGRYTIRTRGVRSNRLDTYIELFDSDLNSIGKDDDGGDNVDSRLSLHLESGLYYLKVECLDEYPEQPYTISIEAEAVNEK